MNGLVKAYRRAQRLGAVPALVLAGTILLLNPAPARAASSPVTLCTALDICYCVNPDYRDAITVNVARVRQLIADNRAQGKAIGYLSVPLSPAGGGAYLVNSDMAKATAEHVGKRFGARTVYLLNPGEEGSDAMQGASGADYMYMWTQILEGQKGLGEDFDFFYFSGPTDFARYFELTGTADLERLEAWFDDKIATNPKYKDAIANGSLTKAGFRNYYGLRASVAFSYGSHDEWNIARLINDRRRGAADFGIANQLAVLFDGQPVSPGGYETPTASGDVGRCIK
ncbi:hypothetical protein ACQR1W_13215 [Bradyrhizobium sp. HKCCYLS1011]|uniref:hypothetical protein n=1 Tax=Bradyrhizobium sp. HKCCYLS1011 TaxID=3420733 RepID=UPI003EBE4C9B